MNMHRIRRLSKGVAWFIVLFVALGLIGLYSYDPIVALRSSPQFPASGSSEFLSGGAIFGGEEAEGYVLSDLTFSKMDGYIRASLVFNREGETSNPVPAYVAALQDYPPRLYISVRGVQEAGISGAAFPDEIRAVRGGLDQGVYYLVVYLRGPAMFRAVERRSPTALDIDIKPYERQPFTVYAVRVTATSSAEEVVSAQQELESAGFEATVILADDLTTYVVEAGVFRDLESAQALKSALAEKGIEAEIHERGADELPAVE